MFGEIFKNSFFMTSSALFQKAVFFFLTILLARYLGVEAFGVWSFILAFTATFMVFSNIGLNRYVIREVAKDNLKKDVILKNLIYIKLFISLVTFLVLSVSIFLLSGNSLEIVGIILLGFSKIFGTLSGAYGSMFIALKKFSDHVRVKVVNTVLLFCGYVFVLLLGFGIVELLLVTVFVELIVLFYSIFLWKKYALKKRFSFDFGLVKKIIFESLPFGILTAISFIYFNIDILLIRYFFESFEIGLYTVATKLILGIILIPATFSRTLFPYLSNLNAKSKSETKLLVRKSLFYNFLTGLGLALIVFFSASFIIRVFFGDAYSGSVVVLKILSFFIVVSSVNMVLKTYLGASNNLKLFVNIMLIGIFINLVLNLFLLPLFYLSGAAIATVVSEVIVLFMLLFKSEVFV